MIDRDLLDRALAAPRALTGARSSSSTTSSRCPLPEVAAILGIPLGTAKSRLHRAIGILRATTAGERRAGRRARRRKGGSHDPRSTASSASCRPPCRDVGGPARARLPHRHPRADRPYPTATRLGLPRKVAPHGSHDPAGGDRPHPVEGDGRPRADRDPDGSSDRAVRRLAAPRAAAVRAGRQRPDPVRREWRHLRR